MGVAELERKIKDPNFLGTLALAGASDLQDAMDSVLTANLSVLNGLFAFVIYGAKTVYPELEVKDVLTNKALGIYTTSVEDGCSAASGAFAAIPANEMLLPNWRENQSLKQFQQNRPGAQPVYGPLLLVGGGDDVIFTEPAGFPAYPSTQTGG